MSFGTGRAYGHVYLSAREPAYRVLILRLQWSGDTLPVQDGSGYHDQTQEIPVPAAQAQVETALVDTGVIVTAREVSWPVSSI